MTPEQHRAHRRARILRIRKRVAAASVIVFIALFSTICVQMAFGHDPALGSKKSQTTKAKAQTQAQTSTDSSEHSATEQEQQDTQTQQSTPSAVTTSQS
jgi:hypothetical protein